MKFEIKEAGFDNSPCLSVAVSEYNIASEDEKEFIHLKLAVEGFIRSSIPNYCFEYSEYEQIQSVCNNKGALYFIFAETIDGLDYEILLIENNNISKIRYVDDEGYIKRVRHVKSKEKDTNKSKGAKKK